MEKKKKNNLLLNVLTFLCGAIFIGCGIRLGMYYFEYKNMDKTYSEIKKEVIEPITLDADIEGLLKNAPKVNMEKLIEINPEIRGYILIPNTKISYPIVHNEDQLKYLNYDVYGNKSRAGAIFLDSNGDPNFNSQNTIIFGHNMFDGSMFSDIGKYSEDEDFFNAHSYVYIYTREDLRIYRIFAGYITLDGSDTYLRNLRDYTGYIIDALNSSTYHHEDKPSGEPIITLSTCVSGGDDQRYVAQAYLVKTVDLPQ